MKTRVEFFERHPAPDMTRDEAVGWLLGTMSPMSAASAFTVSWAVGAMVDGMKEGIPVEVETPQGLYWLSVTVSGRWWRRVRTYHAEER